MKKIFLIVFVFTGLISFGQKQKTYLITDFGAIADGKTMNTIAIQKAIDKAAAAGGGKVIIPVGRFFTGVIY